MNVWLQGHEMLACCEDLKISKIFECCFECIERKSVGVYVQGIGYLM